MNARTRPSKPRQAAKRTLAVVVMMLLFFYVVLPQWAKSKRSADLVAQVNPLLLLAALGLEIASLLAYTVLTRVTLPPEPKLGLFTILRIQLSTKAVTNLVPGGSAAGGTLGYRLFTQAGVESTAAGFSMATVGLGSAVVLNLMLWLALLISIPINGFQPLYGTAAIVGLVIIGGAGAIVLLLMKGRDRAEQVLRAIARRMPFVEGTPPPGSSTKSPTASTSWPSSPRSSATASSGPLRTGSSMPRPCGCSSGPSANPSARST